MQGVRLHKSARRKDQFPFETIRAPEVFSLLENPEELVEFLAAVDKRLRTRHLSIDMRGIKTLTPEAVAAFVAVIRHAKLTNAKVTGNFPESQSLAAKLADFGFYDQVNTNKPAPSAGLQSGSIVLKKNEYRLEKDDVVQADIAAKMVDFARKLCPGDLHKSVYSMFIEATTNTVEHASNTRAPVQWVAGAYFDKERNVMSFTVIDRGVGILNSVKFQRAVSSLWGRVAWTAGERLKQLFLGKMRSRTLEPHRGRGIPGAFGAFKAGRIADLAIIANRGFAHAKADRYVQLGSTFDGTIIYWEARGRGADK